MCSPYKLPKLNWIRSVDSRGYAKVLLQADRPAELITAWTADTKNTTRRDWRWAKLNNDYVEWPTGHNATGLNDQVTVKLFKGFRPF